LEKEVAESKMGGASRAAEVEQLKAEVERMANEIREIRDTLEASRGAEQEAVGMVERVQTEVESLRNSWH
jgi:predicted  nucleic acid-binding Zn-ribbon protein